MCAVMAAYFPDEVRLDRRDPTPRGRPENWRVAFEVAERCLGVPVPWGSMRDALVPANGPPNERRLLMYLMNVWKACAQHIAEQAAARRRWKACAQHVAEQAAARGNQGAEQGDYSASDDYYTDEDAVTT